jgi:hypothetical protein
MHQSAIALAAVMALGTVTAAVAAPQHGGIGRGGGVPHASFSAPAGGGVRSSFAAPNVGRASGTPNTFARTPGNFAAPQNHVAAGGWRGHGRRFGYGFGGLYAFGGPDYYGYDAYGDGCWQRRLVPTPFGLRWRLVDVCAY